MPASSPITIVEEDQSLEVDTTGDPIYPQRRGDEFGVLQIELNQDPGAGSSGTIVTQAKLDLDASWVTVQSVPIVSFQGNNSQIITDVRVYPAMRFEVSGPTGVAVGTTYRIWFME